MSDIDRDLLVDLAGGETEARELLALYFESAFNLLSRLRTAHERQDRGGVNKAAHQMAGAAGTCGFERLEEHLRAIETGAEEITWADLERKMGEAATLLEAARVDATKLFPEEHPEA